MRSSQCRSRWCCHRQGRFWQAGLLHLFLFCFVLISTSSAGNFYFDSSSEARMMKRKVRAALFLHRATFGPTQAEIDALAEDMARRGTRRACSDWIDAQMALSPSLHKPLAKQMYSDDGYNGTENGVWIQRYRWHAWYHNAIAAPDQLRQRVAFALSQILVTSEDGAGFNDRNLGNGLPAGQAEPRWLGPTDYYDLMVQHAFGDYRELLEDVTYHPVMGVYLSHVRNRKSDGVRFPDENYAREIMQLFSIGLYELQLDGRLKKTLDGELIPTYDNETIKNFARVFTGLTYSYRDGDTASTRNAFWRGNDLNLPMVMYQPEHDTDPKTLLGGEVIDLDNGVQEIDRAIDNLFAHRNVAPFIAYRLIQRLVKSNPSRGYIRRVAKRFNNNGRGQKGDLAAVVKAVLLDPEAWRSVRIRQRRRPTMVQVVSRGTEHTRLREPTIRYMHLLRSLKPQSNYPSTGRFMLTPLDWVWEQAPYRSPSVFNFWLPSYQPPGDLIGFQPSRRIPNGNLVAPEFQMKTSVTSNYLIQKYIWDISGQYARFSWNGSSYDIQFDLDTERNLVATEEGLATFVDQLDLMHCCGTMPQDYKELIVSTIQAENMNNDQRMENALIAVVTSPFAAIAE